MRCAKASCMRKKYSTDTTDAEWEILEPFFPEAQWHEHLQEPKYRRRDIVDAIFYRMRAGCQWHNLPHDFPPWKQVFEYYRRWKRKGLIEHMHNCLRDRVREMTPHGDGTEREVSATACILDSQSAKTSEEGSSVCGFDAGKRVKGRKRHIVVDMLGLILAMSVTRAGVQDRDVALSLIGQAKEEHAGLSVAYMDGGYRGSLESRIEKDTGVRVEIVLRSDTQKKVSRSYPGDGSSNEPSAG